jgi:hypothetical protein
MVFSSDAAFSTLNPKGEEVKNDAINIEKEFLLVWL